jgi:hypothetical protein
LECGEGPVPVLGQLNFQLGAVALVYMAGFTVTPVTFIKLAIMSGAKHIVACKLKLKRTMVKALTGGNV